MKNLEVVTFIIMNGLFRLSLLAITFYMVYEGKKGWGWVLALAVLSSLYFKNGQKEGA